MISAYIARGLAVLCWSPWLIAECAKCGFSGKATRPGVHPLSELENYPWVHRPIAQYGRPNYIGAYVRTICTSQTSNRTCDMVVAYRDCLTHKPITAHQFGAPRRVRIGIGVGIGCVMAAKRWVWANEISIYFLRREQCLTHVLTRGIRAHTNFTSELST